MTVNNMFNVRFQMTNKQTDDELKARFMCRFPKAMTRAYSGNQPFNDYTLSRLFQVETEDPRGAESFSLDLGQALGTNTDVGVPVDRIDVLNLGRLEELDDLGHGPVVVL